MQAIKPDLDHYDAVVFDLFHTLISLQPVYADGNTAWDYLGIDVDDWSRALFSDADDRLRGRISDPVEVMRDIVCKLVPDIDSEATEQASRIRLDQFEAALSNVHDHVLETIGEIRSAGKQLGLISNADAMEIASWHGSRLAGCFDSAVFSCRTGFIKPEKEIYHAALDQLGVPPERCLFVGDGGNNELAGAREVGMDAAITLEFVPDPDTDAMRQRRAQADFELLSITDLRPRE